jgi:hypothetical protein
MGRCGFSKGLVAAGAIWLAAAAGAWAQAGNPAPGLDFSALIAAARVKGPIDFCGETVPLHVPEVRERMEREMLSVLAEPDEVVLWIKRSAQVLVPIEAELKRQGLPQDLKYVAVAESALRPHAGSPKGAMGFWQFIPSTGQKYGLQVDSAKDERRSLEPSTAAALAYLRDLKAMFGSWSLAVAAYNMGENGLRGEIRQQETEDYYQLYLPLETQRYLFRILAAKLILQEPAKYGFRLEPDDVWAAVPVEKVRFAVEKEIPLIAVARAAGTTFKVVKDLNPDIRGYRLAAGTHDLWVPQSGARGFPERLAGWLLRWEGALRETTHVVREGDTLSEIAERHGVTAAELREWNRLDPKRMIQPGMRLVIRTREPPAAGSNP